MRQTCLARINAASQHQFVFLCPCGSELHIIRRFVHRNSLICGWKAEKSRVPPQKQSFMWIRCHKTKVPPQKWPYMWMKGRKSQVPPQKRPYMWMDWQYWLGRWNLRVVYTDLVVKQGLNFEILSFQPTVRSNHLTKFLILRVFNERQYILSGQVNICIGQPFFQFFNK